MITVVDYGMGNLGSILQMFERIGADAKIASDAAAIREASKILLPGVGRFDRAMQLIEERGLRSALDEKALDEKVPVLGICLGMQLLARHSEEGDAKGLGWIPSEVKRFARTELRVPHMGWNEATVTRESPLLADLPLPARFYFVHSYYVKADDARDVILRSTYGHEFDAAVQRGNIYGAQFHPERSHKFGMTILKNFARL